MTPQTEAAVIGIMSAASRADVPVLRLGALSNLVVGRVADDVTVVDLRQLRGLEWVRSDTVRIAAGEMLPGLARRFAAQGLSGLEWAEGVPGTLGGATVMNAGAFDSDIVDRIEYVDLLNEAGQRVRLAAGELAAAHRTTAIDPARHTVLAVCLRGRTADRQQVQHRMLRNRAYRRATQPTGATLGSTFRRHPIPGRGLTSAGWLLERAGMSGYVTTSGRLKLSELHANFMLNSGGADFADVGELVDAARTACEAVHDVSLQLEIHVWEGRGYSTLMRS